MKKILTAFLIIGLLFLAGAIFVTHNEYQFSQNAINRPGTVISLDRRKSENSYVYHPIISFITNEGQTIEFRSSFGSNPPRHSVGDEVDIIYSPDDPHQAQINDFMSLWFVSIMLTIFGVVFFLIGFIPFALTRSKNKKRKRLLDTGQRVLAKFEQVELNRSLKVNNRSPYQIICQWQDPLDPTRVHVFQSENIWFNPEEYISSKQIAVYLDTNNPKNYYVDISFLPQKV